MNRIAIAITATINKKPTPTRGPKHAGSSSASFCAGAMVGLGSLQLLGGSLIPRAVSRKPWHV